MFICVSSYFLFQPDLLKTVHYLDDTLVSLIAVTCYLRPGVQRISLNFCPLKCVVFDSADKEE